MNIEIIRHHILKNLRDYLYQKGYIEVFSPIIRDADSKINPRFNLTNGKFLRDCMELPLRKKVSTVCPRVFEIGPCFRQDKEDSTHRVEFYMMELYSKDETLQDMIEVMNGIITKCMPTVDAIKRVSIRDFIIADLNVDVATTDTHTLVREIIDKRSHLIKESRYPHLVVNKYIKLFVEPTLSDDDCLYFLTDYPLCTIAIASRKDDSNCIQRFECFINGMEIGNAFEDCMDVEDLEPRLRQSGVMSEEEKELIELVKNNQIPPTVGLGIGIDRLCMLLTLKKVKGVY